MPESRRPAVCARLFKPLFEREISIRTIARRRQFAEARLRRDNERSMRVRPGISRKTKKRHEIRGVSRSIDLRPSAETNEFGHPLMEVIKLIAIRGVIVRGPPPGYSERSACTRLCPTILCGAWIPASRGISLPGPVRSEELL